MVKEKEAKEATDEVIKARKRALRGKVGFAKLVWKEFSMDVTVFEWITNIFDFVVV
jgi:hypothetical protein